MQKLIEPAIRIVVVEPPRPKLSITCEVGDDILSIIRHGDAVVSNVADRDRNVGDADEDVFATACGHGFTLLYPASASSAASADRIASRAVDVS